MKTETAIVSIIAQTNYPRLFHNGAKLLVFLSQVVALTSLDRENIGQIRSLLYVILGANRYRTLTYDKLVPVLHRLPEGRTSNAR